MTNPRHRVKVVSATDKGCVRDHNEDCVGQDEDIGLAILADGMGGHLAGEVASSIAVSTILNELRGTLRSLTPGQTDEEGIHTLDSILIRVAIEKANTAIYDLSSRSAAHAGMGTTVVVAAFYNDRISVAHVGDSRLYRLRENHLVQLTVDHSLGDELVAKGCFNTLEEVAAAGLKSAITRALGVEPEIAVDLWEDTVHGSDTYLLCSDGLTDMVKEKEIQDIIEKKIDHPKQAVEQLIAAAKRYGGSDNISVILACPYLAYMNSSSWFRRFIHPF